jgi:hypothetical protein
MGGGGGGHNIPMVLACIGGAGDVITGVDFATFGVDGVVTGMCGAFRAVEKRGKMADVVAAVSKACVGRASCALEVSAAALGVEDPAPGVVKTLTVEWTCTTEDSKLEGTAVLPPLPLRTTGPDIVDASGRRLHLAAINWAGGENVNYVVSGLDLAPLRTVAKLIAAMGFNAVRIPFSVALARDNPVVNPAAVAANPTLFGLSALQVMDQVVDELALHGLLVVGWMGFMAQGFGSGAEDYGWRVDGCKLKAGG